MCSGLTFLNLTFDKKMFVEAIKMGTSKPVRNQILEIDAGNTVVNSRVDAEATTGVGYSVTSTGVTSTTSVNTTSTTTPTTSY